MQLSNMIRGKTGMVITISLAVLMLSLYVLRTWPQIIAPLQNIVFDTYQQMKPRTGGDSAVMVVDVDESSIARLGQWPWPRTTIAELVNKARDSGALAIGFDMAFSEPDRTSPRRIAQELASRNSGNADLAELSRMLAQMPDNDEQFADTIRTMPVVLGFFNGEGKADSGLVKKPGVVWLGEDLTRLLPPQRGVISSLAKLQEAAAGAGAISLAGDRTDEVIREVPLFNAYNGSAWPSLSVELLRLAIENVTGEAQSFVIKTSQASGESSGGVAAITEARVANFTFPLTADGKLKLYFARQDTSRTVSAHEVLSRNADELRPALEGKILIVGTSASGLRDIRTTALRETVPGVEIHAQIIDQIMQGTFLSRPDWAFGMEWLLLAVTALIIILLVPFMGPAVAALLGASIVAAVGAISWYAFSRHGLLLDPVFPMVGGLLIYSMTTLMVYASTEREKRYIRSAFSHYLAPDLVARLEAAPESLRLGGEVRDMTLMFLDIRGFTQISERLTPEELVSFLNALLSPLSEIIQEHEGAIDKYIGDSIMAFWNAPLDVDNHPRKACIAALALVQKVDELNARDSFGFSAKKLPPVAIGVGVSTGDGCVGNMGSSRRFDYSVVGDTVNVAARLEGATKETGWPILVARETHERSSELAYLRAGRLNLKGKSGAQEVYALVGDAGFASSPDFVQLRETQDRMWQALEQGNIQEARELGEACASLAPERLQTFLHRLASSLSLQAQIEDEVSN
jgi:adenylate cyclase